MIYLHVLLLAVVMLPPENFTYTVNETNSVTFVCVMVGIPAPSISFYRNGRVHFLLQKGSKPPSGGTLSKTFYTPSIFVESVNNYNHNGGVQIFVGLS